MRINKKIIIGIFLFGIIFLVSLISGSYMASNPQYIQPGTGTFRDSGFDSSVCEAGQDFIIQVAPFGCTPLVVRSDLLEEQSIPVFCQLAATQINPLIDIEAIDSISFSGEYPKEVSGIGFHPAKSALGVKTKLNSPILENIGYVVIFLKQQKNESAMPDFVEGTLTAKIKYDIENAFGVGKASFYLPQMDEEEWDSKYKQSSFWNSKGFLRAEDIGTNRATILVYDKSLRRVSTVNLEKGQTSGDIFLSGFDFCQGSLQLRLDSLEKPDTRAKLRVNADVAEVAEYEKFLDNKCQIRKIEKQGLVQKVTIRCDEDERPRTFDLKIEPKVVLNINGKEKNVSVGDVIDDFGETKEKRIFLGYIGETDKGESFIVPVISTKRTKEQFLDSFAYKNLDVFVKATLFAKGRGVLTSVITTIIKGTYGPLVMIGKFILTGSYPVGLYYQGLNEVDPLSTAISSVPIVVDFLGGIKTPEIEFVDFALPKDEELDGDALEYYKSAKQDYQKIIDTYSGEEFDNLILGEEALYNLLSLSNSLNQKRTMIELCQEFKSRYPESNKDLNDCEDDYRISNTEDSVEYVFINGRSKKISFDGVYEPGFEDYGVKVLISNAGNYSGEYDLVKNQNIFLSENDSIILKEVEDDFAIFDVRGVKQGTLAELTYKPANLKIDLNDYRIVGDKEYKISLTKINLKKSAKVSVIPKINNVGTEADFNFKIGIEKRAFKLSPEKIKEKIEQLDESIKKWEGVSENLDKFIKTSTAACLATTTVLTVKNFLFSLKGKGIARQMVMRGKDGWYERCADLVNAGEYISQEQCLIKESDEIDKDVDAYYDLMSIQNDEIEDLEKKFTTKKFLSEKAVNTSGFMQDYSVQVQGELGSLGDNFKGLNMAAIAAGLTYDGWREGIYDLSQLREIEFYTMALEKNPNDERASERLYSLFSEVESASAEYLRLKQIEKKEEEKGFTGMTFEPYSDASKKIETYNGFIAPKDLGEINKSDLVQGISYNHIEYYAVLSDLGNNNYRIIDIYTLEGVKTDDDDSIKNTYSYFKKYDASAYENEFKRGTARVRYYETEPYQGMPAIVPFDLKNGWYAATKQVLPVGRNIQTFDASGAVSSFWLCNIGENSLEEFYSGFGDDICQLINLGTGQPYNQFAGLSESEASRLVRSAMDAIAEASRQHSRGIKTVSIKGQRIQVGEPAVDIPDIQCQDFMSPKDCNLIFNFCDPVICPSSRCDFGGEYPVKNVIQSGIVGSALLCLPNWWEGIRVPFCVTGIKAGIDGFLSIQNSYKDCLQESLDTGQTTGICDEIQSVYICEFFWRQAFPLVNIAIPKMTEVLLGQNVRGGGEYLGVENAWQSAKDSATYFTQSYGANSFKAFKTRSTEEIVTTAFCKGFGSLVGPETGNLFDSLIEPASPPQFHGRFDEIPLTTVTVPPTSHYKVFYHIFAGKNSGAYYSVYLKQGSGGSFYQDVSTIRPVASGYIGIGGYATETKDFSAPTGYKQLCINVNGQEECGFKEVSTSFALDYISDKYLADQTLQTDITKQKDCISGTPSIYNLLNPNIQEGAGDVINPEIYNQGIIRICATRNPGEGTGNAGTEDSRWVEVGYCGDKKIKCWLDTKSVKDAIEFTSIEEGALKEVSENYLDVLINREGYLNEEEFSSVIDSIEDTDMSEDKINSITEVLEKVFFNHQKGYLYLLRGNVYGDLAFGIYQEAIKKATAPEDKGTEALREELEDDISDLGAYPIFEFKDGTLATNVNYRYFGSKWHWSFSKDNWISLDDFVDINARELTEKDKDFVKSLQDKNYLDGLNLLVQRTLNAKEGGFKPELTTKNVDMSSKGIFEVKKKYEGVIKSVYFKYTDKWVVNFAPKVLEDYEDYWSPVLEIVLDKEKSEASFGDKKVGGLSLSNEIINLVNSLNRKSFKQGFGTIFNIFYLEEEAEEEVRVDIKEEIDLGEFTEKQLRIIEGAKNCKDCDKITRWNQQSVCDEELCAAIGIQLGNNCAYEIVELELQTKGCVHVKWEKTEKPLKTYTLSEALEQVNLFSIEYGNVKLNLNDKLKQFVWDLELNKILTEKQYNDLSGKGFYIVKTLKELRNVLILGTK